jgi:GT2 family glycosyltransferase
MPPAPTFSIIIPTYRRPAQLAACLAAVARLDYPRERHETIVVDDGSGAPPVELVAAHRARMTVTLIAAAHLGPAAARNAGSAVATGDYLAFTDDDCAPVPGWLTALAAATRAAPAHLLGGHTVNALPTNPYASASQVLVDYLYARYNTATGGPRFFTSNNMAVPAAAFRELGGFDTGFPLAAGEDRDLCDRWLATGRGMTHVPAAVVHHRHALTLVRFWRQHLHYGRGAARFHQARLARGRGRVAVEPPAFYLDLVRAPLARGCPRAPLLMALLVLSQVANVIGYARERAARARALAPARGLASPRRPR